MPTGTTPPPTLLSTRAAQKADRRARLRREAARLVAERGYHGVRLDDIGAAAGISGPAVYRYFPSKEALLTDLLSDISGRLLEGGRRVADAAAAPRAAMCALVDFHLDFSLSEPELIRIQDRDLHNLPDEARHYVRQTQRRYAELWVLTLCAARPRLEEADARIRVHACFGLLNSTPHSAGSDPERSRTVLREMALDGLLGSAANRG